VSRTVVRYATVVSGYALLEQDPHRCDARALRKIREIRTRADAAAPAEMAVQFAARDGPSYVDHHSTPFHEMPAIPERLRRRRNGESRWNQSPQSLRFHEWIVLEALRRGACALTPTAMASLEHDDVWGEIDWLREVNAAIERRLPAGASSSDPVVPRKERDEDVVRR
jgi:hypothetical protein